MSQAQGVAGKLVAGMIRRSVRARFHSVHWQRPVGAIRAPAILYANHHGWMDGYLMFHVIERLGLRSVDWIEEFDSFPLFRFIGGMRFAKGDAAGRAKTLRKTLRLMNEESGSLVIFPEGQLHRGPSLFLFGRSLEFIAKNVKGVSLVPVGIRYDMSLHERPEAWIRMGEPHSFNSLGDCEFRVKSILEGFDPIGYEVLVTGTKDVNERFARKQT